MHTAPYLRGGPRATARYSGMITAAIAAATAVIYVLLAFAPAMDANITRTRLRGAAAALGSAIPVVETSYANGDLTAADPHLGLPGSAAYCAHLWAMLPDTGRAVLSCMLRGETLPTRVTWLRAPSGAWRCEAQTSGSQAPPVQCHEYPKTASDYFDNAN